MEIALTLLGSGLGVLVGLFVADLKQRSNDRAELVKAGTDFREAQAKLAELHNQAIKDFKALSDKVMSHEMAFKAKPLR